MSAVLLNRIIVVLSLAGIVVAGTLTYAHYANVIVPCGAGGGCEKVTNDPSSMWGPLPVSLYGLAGYFVIFAIAAARMFAGIEKTRSAGVLAYWFSMVGAMISIGLQIYSGTVIHSWCKWCIASAAIMVLLFLVHAALLQIQSGETPPEPSELELEKRRGIDIATLAAAGVLCVGSWTFVNMFLARAWERAPSFTLTVNDISHLLPTDVNSKGPADAPITIVEFGDLCCPACQKSYEKVTELFTKHEGKVRLVFRHFPLISEHEQALLAACYAEYAGEKGRFWDFVDRCYATPLDQLTKKETFENILIGLNLDVGEAEKEAKNENSNAFNRVYRDWGEADKLGVQVTPTFFVVLKGEKPFSSPIGELMTRFEKDSKFLKLLGEGG